MAKFKRIFHSYQGRNFLSRWALLIFEKPTAQNILSLLLLLSVFSFSILTPQVLAFKKVVEATNVSPSVSPVIETVTETTFRSPLEKFLISQGFSFVHWGLDLTTEEGQPVYPIAKGRVLEISQTSWGYGNYVLIDHQNGQKSLYAHLAKIEVKKGDSIDKPTVIGRVGQTGWATGPHLHLEIYSAGLPLNPSEVLPL